MNKFVRRSILTALCLLATSANWKAVAEAPKSFAYRTSSTQSFSDALGANCVPAYIMQNKVAHQGIFIVSAPTSDVGKKMGIAPGMVLLTVDNYTMISARALDSWLLHRSKHGPITFTYARDNNGAASVQSGSVEAAMPTASTASAASSPLNSAPSRAIFSPPPASSIGSHLIVLLNASRVGGGLSPLHIDSELARYAQSYADYLASNASKYDVNDSHNNPHVDLNGRGSDERARSAGLSNYLNENIGRNTHNIGLQSVRLLHDQMMASAGHRSAIMDPQASAVGIGAAYAGPRLFLVEEFGR